MLLLTRLLPLCPADHAFRHSSRGLCSETNQEGRRWPRSSINFPPFLLKFLILCIFTLFQLEMILKQLRWFRYCPLVKFLGVYFSFLLKFSSIQWNSWPLFSWELLGLQFVGYDHRHRFEFRRSLWQSGDGGLIWIRLYFLFAYWYVAHCSPLLYSGSQNFRVLADRGWIELGRD